MVSPPVPPTATGLVLLPLPRAQCKAQSRTRPTQGSLTSLMPKLGWGALPGLCAWCWLGSCPIPRAMQAVPALSAHTQRSPCPRNGAARAQPAGLCSTNPSLGMPEHSVPASVQSSAHPAPLGAARSRVEQNEMSDTQNSSIPASHDSKRLFCTRKCCCAASPPLASLSAEGKAWLNPQLELGPSQALPVAGHGWDGPAGSVALCGTAGLLGDIWWHPLSDVLGCEAAGKPRAGVG